MITRFSTTATSFALAVLLAGCSKTPEQSTATGLTPASSDAAPANDAPAKVVDAPPPPKVSAVTVRAGTPIKIRTETTLSTKTINTGDAFTATLAEPIIVEGQVVAPRGSQVEGVVAESDPGGRVKGVATISVRLTRLRVGNRRIEIHTGTVVRRAHATRRKDAAKVGIGAGIGAAMLGFSPYYLAIAVAIMSPTFVVFGIKIGTFFQKFEWIQKFTFLPGVLLIIIGIWKL